MFNLVVHGVCVGKVAAVLSQHLWEHDVPLVSKENISELFLLGYHPTWRRCHKRCQPRKSRAECWRHGCQGQSPMDFPATQSIYWHLCFSTVLPSLKACQWRPWSCEPLDEREETPCPRSGSDPFLWFKTLLNKTSFVFGTMFCFPISMHRLFWIKSNKHYNLLILILWIVTWPSHCFGSGRIDFPNIIFFSQKKNL